MVSNVVVVVGSADMRRTEAPARPERKPAVAARAAPLSARDDAIV